ncbi:AvrD family protein [Arthrobacter sp. RAF14]|uniref:AvrD family protein n=1 Tax=Arthrobacter sp. RAF14 TaxID=3233051 RepID=UPI003F92BF5C
MGEKPGGTSLEEELGPAQHRYFGGGYRQVEHELTEDDDGEGASWEGRVTYPVLWSRGPGGAARQPHLSSVDALVLPLAALAKARSRWLANGRMDSQYWVPYVRIRAGREPWDRLAEVPVTLEMSRRTLDGRALEWCAARVGNMKVDLGLAVAASRPSSDAGTISDLDYRGHSITSSVDRLYGPVRELRSRHVLAVGASDRHASAHASAVDFLVTMGQLAQALVYRAQSTDRSRVGNLWMRTMTITVRSGGPIAPGPFDAVTTLDRQGTVVINGRPLRTVRVRSLASVGVEGVADLAYFGEG